MDPRIEISQVLGPSLLAALQAKVQGDQVQALLAELGQTLDLVLFARDGDTVRLRLPSGQVFEAEGQLPFPLGTRVTVQVQAPADPGAGPRLRLLEAAPPPPVPILAPLLQGEAQPLMDRLMQAELPAELAPLLKVLESLQDPGLPVAPPASRILAALQALPEPARQILQTLVPSAGSSLPELAQALRSGIEGALREVSETLPAGNSPALPARLPAPEPAAPTALPKSPAGTPANPGPVAAKAPEAAAAPPAPQAAKAAPAPPPRSPPVVQPAPGKPSPPAQPTLPETAATPGPSQAPKGSGEAAPPAVLPGRPARPDTPVLPVLVPEDPPAAPAAAPDLAVVPGRKQAPELPALVLERLEAQLLARPDAPAEAREPLRALIRHLLQGMETPQPTRRVPSVSSAPSSRAEAEASPQMQRSVGAPRQDAPAPPGATPARGQGTAAPGAPERWEAWLRGGTQALSDPKLSPREAPFHLAQAQEGTAFFELPVPWLGSASTLELWVETDPGEGNKGSSGERVQRVLVGVNFSSLGETRVGLAQGAGTLQVRIWTEAPGLLKDREPALREELAQGGLKVDLRVLPLGEEGAPSLRSILTGGGYQAIG